jgi:SET domain-containing protein
MYVSIYEKDIPGKGMGVFAFVVIATGTLFWKLTESKKFTKEDWYHLPEDLKKVAYPDILGKYIAAQGMGESWNHSCDANTWWTADDELSARRDIQKDEEITYDYATTDIDKTKGNDEEFPWECKCGTKNCRKILHWNDILKPEIYELHKGHLPSWVEKLLKNIKNEITLCKTRRKCG